MESDRRALVVAAGVLVVCALRGTVVLTPAVVEGGRRLLTLDGEGRRRLVYGDCDGRGYGYIRAVTRGIPRDRGLPRVRSGDENYPSDAVLPEDDWNREARVVLGIGFTEDEFLARLRAADGPSFRIVHRRGGCFTAIAPELGREGAGDSSGWQAWLARLRELP